MYWYTINKCKTRYTDNIHGYNTSETMILVRLVTLVYLYSILCCKHWKSIIFVDAGIRSLGSQSRTGVILQPRAGCAWHVCLQHALEWEILSRINFKRIRLKHTQILCKLFNQSVAGTKMLVKCIYIYIYKK